MNLYDRLNLQFWQGSSFGATWNAGQYVHESKRLRNTAKTVWPIPIGKNKRTLRRFQRSRNRC